MSWPRLSIQNTVVLAVLVSVLGPTALLWHGDQRLTRSVHEPLIAQSRQALLGAAASALVQPLWTIHREAIENTVHKVLDAPSVVGVRLLERRPGSVPVVVSRPHAPADAVVLSATILHEGETLGTLELLFNPHQLDEVLAARSRATLQLAVLQVGLAALVMFLVLYLRLLRPIGRLKLQAQAIATRADPKPVDWRRRDELGEVGEQLNRVHGQINALVGKLEAQKSELHKLALHDALTGLPNRALFRELSQAAVAGAQRREQRLAVVFIDLDRFKAINDTLGHGAGDTLLVTLSARLRQALRGADLLSRHSGDEFLALLRDVGDADAIAVVVNRMLAELEAPISINGREVSITASIGVSLYPDDSLLPEELIQFADTAMYAAKTLGRARYSFYRSELNAQLQATVELERELRRAIAGDEFVLHYQPQVLAGSGALVGCEALIRWQHPVRGMVPPGEFIPAAEACGLISDLGTWAVRAACAQIQAWKAQGVPFITVAVNVSALEFRHHRLVDTVTQAMAEFGVAPDELEFEITESVLMTDSQTTQSIVERLHAIGLRLAVDDFGTGYSSLAYLKRLRPSKVKIDRSFVRDLSDDEDDRVLVKAIVHLAHALDTVVVAEGVETDAQRDILRGFGCDMLQGFLISRPKPAAAFAALAFDLSGEQTADDPPTLIMA